MKINIYKNTEELSKAFCNSLFQLMLDKEKFYIALSGGNTPKKIFQTLAKDFRKRIDWNKVHILWGDERCVPPDDPDSNYRMTKEYLLNHIDTPEENIHRIRGENDPGSEAERYSIEIKKYLPEVNGLPQFDFVMLGLGEDGHTASIFSNQMELLSSEKICDVSVHPASGQKRITITGNIINNSKQIYFLVTGKKKSYVADKILNKKDDYLKFPAANINPVNSQLVWLLDSEAAAELTK